MAEALWFVAGVAVGIDLVIFFADRSIRKRLDELERKP